MLNIFVKSLTGKTISLEVNDGDSLGSIKRKILDREGVPINRQTLIYSGKPLNDEFTFGSEHNECILHLVLKEEPMEDKKSDSKPMKKSVKSKVSSKASYSGSDDDDRLETKETKSFSKSKTAKAYSKSEVTDSYSTPTEVIPQKPLVSDEAKFQDMLASFAGSSSNVEIVFSFDTTGSMSACLQEVRNKVKETVTRLMKDIPKIRIGIIGHGDYCDGKIAITTLDLCDNVKKICKFVESVTATGGGDAPEAYELVLRDARKLSWTEGYSKALVMIGDEVPHPPSYTTEKINWFDEVDKLTEMGVKLYGVRALNQTNAIPFYEELAERSGGVSINFQSFKLIVDMFLAICYREASPEKLQAFEQEVKDKGNMNEELGNIFETLAKPNLEIKKEKEKTLKSPEHWFDIANDNGSPQYEWDGNKWIPYTGKVVIERDRSPSLPVDSISKPPTTERKSLAKRASAFFTKPFFK